jgi:uncharacterized protein YjbI with pentapeptide repeats
VRTVAAIISGATLSKAADLSGAAVSRAGLSGAGL